MEKVALITGASKGLGFETAYQLGVKGYAVIVAARTQQKSNETAEKLKSKGVHAVGMKLDVVNDNDVDNLSKSINEHFGKLDVLVNNAGVQLDFPGFMPGNSTETVSMDILKQTFEINYFAPIALTQKLLPLLKKSTAGRIVNVSSIMGSLALHADSNSPIYGIKLLAYNSSKTALNQFTLHLAEAMKDSPIKVNSAHPGWVKTDLGGEYAPMSIEDGVKTIVDLSTLDENGPTGAFIHLGESLPW
jgi:NAD(P)-dependent dehydrogenase (short-subunit alcohol dehydrogenase family)